MLRIVNEALSFFTFEWVNELLKQSHQFLLTYRTNVCVRTCVCMGVCVCVIINIVLWEEDTEKTGVSGTVYLSKGYLSNTMDEASQDDTTSWYWRTCEC